MPNSSSHPADNLSARNLSARDRSTGGPSTGGRRAVIGVLLVLVLATAAAVALHATGRVTLAYDRQAGRPVAILDEVPGPETGPACPIDQRYVDEQAEGLRPDVLAAWQRLRTEAGARGVTLCLNDGKRSVGQQQREFADAVQRFGTAELAARYVLPPEKSMHVKGLAVDIQPLESAAWVEHNGNALGWCRRYQNEEWHFEYDPAYATSGCPAMLPSATSG
ncbi:D-alanyl-D-alanine carboxypeptidase family protein [Saccharothrix australiensis]|uniref:D-alanyl-D-alanine carboxypeptidase-like protein n=1 Tax=Saccharothrix australiensis TaxID=2072 RepID=A0A495W446_9PSEU|nr:D-alanyl-D-alanine carboxypeptidase family protein [Saccharothrix australiensis]RKT56144.1 D-alanyl-D-alanine carboxypeptidase-like protein [Saccharothrix australiensis]